MEKKVAWEGKVTNGISFCATGAKLRITGQRVDTFIIVIFYSRL
jgi:hypothetical protein